MKNHHVLAAAGLLALTACAGQPAASSSAANATPSATTTSTPTTEAAADSLEGTWTTGELSREQLREAALDAGLADAAVEEFFALGLGDPASATFQIRFLDGQATQFMTLPGGGPVPQHDGPYRLEDDETLVWTDGDCDTTASFQLDGDVLTFTEIVEDECPAVDSKVAHLTFLRSAPYTRTD